MYEIVDTFPAFLSYWAQAESWRLDEQIQGWTRYLATWPEILAMQVEDYASQRVDWREIARDKIFACLADRLPAMQYAHDNLLRILGPVHDRALKTLRLDNGVVFVLYVGIGCGARWATSYRGVQQP